MKIEYEIYIVKDSWGNTDYSVVNEPADTVQIVSMKDNNGESKYFESDAYHLENWCNENGFTYKNISRSEII